MDVPEYDAAAEAMRELDKEVKRFEALQKKHQKLYKSISDANENADEQTVQPKSFNDLKKLYKDLIDCCKKTQEACMAAKASLAPLESWQEPGESDAAGEAERKKVKLSASSTGYKSTPLPLWISDDVAPPPLCGRVPFPSEARIVPGDLVATNLSFVKPKDGIQWILCRVERYLGTKRNGYMVSDVAPDEGSAATPFEVPRKALIPLPKTLPKAWDARTEFNKGDAVMALFPGTTSFYEATVMNVPSAKSKVGSSDAVYELQFEDDDDEHGQTPVREIKAAFVIQSQRKK